MKKWITLTLAAGLLAISPAALLAQSSTNATANPGNTTSQTANANKKRAQRLQLLAILGINPKDLKGLTPVDRRAKIKLAADKMIADLEQKQAAGPLTAKEQSDLAALKKFEQHRPAKAKSDS